MGGGAWKVAYADFVTAMMAFFLLMWILSMTSADTKAMLAGIFKGDLQFNPDVISPIGISNNPLIDHAGKIIIDDTVINESEKVEIKMIQQINQFLLKDALPTGSSGITSDGIGVLLHLAPEVLFKPGTVEFTPKGKDIMDEVSKILSMYKAYLVVRGHTDASETGAPYSSKWELSSARANSAINYLLKAKADPSFLRSVAYADTRPAVDESDPNALQKNSRLEFHFHRPEAMSTIVGY